MKKVNGIFQLLVALFFGIALVYFLTYERMWDEELSADKVVPWFLTGLILFLVSWGINMMYISRLDGRIRHVELEKNELKAKLYDLERGVKTRKEDKRIDQKPEDKESSVIKPRENFKE